MPHRTFRGAAVLAVVVLLASAAIAFADTVATDGDALTADNQSTIPLGVRAPGEVVQRNVALNLTCGGTSHPAVGSVIDVAYLGGTIPLDSAVTATSTTIGPVPATWPASGLGCPSPTPTLAANGPTVVTLTMPTTPGKGYVFTLMWSKSGASGLTGFTAMTFTADVVGNTPPVLSLPGPISVEGNTTGGATVDYTASATDLEDNPDPVPACEPASGSLFPIGTTTVACTVTDGGGLIVSGSFTVIVVDTTAPVLVVPADLTAEASGAAGTTVNFTTSASDVVDGSVSVDCDHASGSTFSIGTTTVTCSAVDAAGNPTSGSFNVTVTDTTAPSLIAMPPHQFMTTSNPAGATLAYSLPSASDAVDPSPTVTCSPASGGLAAVGDSTVTCTALDHAGNSASATFQVSVTYVASDSYSVVWGEPVGGSPSALVANQGRTIPIKVEIFVNGVAQTAGPAAVNVAPCGGGDALVVPLVSGSGRWDGHLDTASLRPGCYVATVALDGHDAGSFSLDLRGAALAVKASPTSNASPATNAPARKK
jgi:hypothetical protein